MSFKIFVIDDLAIARKYLNSVIKRLDSESVVVSFSSALEAIRALDSGEMPQLIFVDHEMPGMSGFDFMSKVRRSPKFRSLPISLVTTDCDETEQQLASTLGCLRIIQKPFSSDDIRWVIEAAKKSSVDQGAKSQPIGVEFAKQSIALLRGCAPTEGEQDKNSVAQLKATLHSIFTSCERLPFMELSQFLKLMSSGLSVVLAKNFQSLEKSKKTISESRQWIQAQLEAIVEGRALDEFPSKLASAWEEMREVKIPEVFQQKLEQIEAQFRALSRIESEIESHSRVLLDRYPGDRDAEQIQRCSKQLSEETRQILSQLSEFCEPSDQVA